jgi:hypothetical protein
MSTFAFSTLSGTVNGTNTLFTIPLVPFSVEIYRNGILQSGGDYSIVIGTATTTITFSAAPVTGDGLESWVFTQ